MKKLMYAMIIMITIVSCVDTINYVSNAIGCEHRKFAEYDKHNVEQYMNEEYEMIYYCDGALNICDECETMYYEYCLCESNGYDDICECGLYLWSNDYYAFVNDVVAYEKEHESYNVYELYDYIENETDHESAMDIALNRMPVSVMRLREDLECNVSLVDNIERNEYADGIFIYNHDDYTAIEIEKAIVNQEYVIYHEFGHLLDYGYNKKYESTDKEFRSIYYAEKWYFVDDYNYEYAISCPEEYFAEAFAEYMTNPNRLLENTPLTYEYISNCINNIR